MNEGTGVCPHDDRDRLAVEFLSGRLSDEEAEAFEAHCYACEACFDAVELAASLHAAMRPPAAKRPARVGGAPAWAWAAAAVLVVAVGYGLSRPPVRLADDASALRGGEDAFVLNVEAAAGGRTLRWSAVEGAERYEAHVFTPEGESLWEGRTGDLHLEVPAIGLPTGTRPRRLYARVEALDALGAPVARSPIVPFEGAGGP